MEYPSRLLHVERYFKVKKTGDELVRWFSRGHDHGLRLSTCATYLSDVTLAYPYFLWSCLDFSNPGMVFFLLILHYFKDDNKLLRLL